MRSALGALTILFLIIGAVFYLNLKAPDSLEEPKNNITKVLEVFRERGSNILKNLWENEILPIWRNMWDYAKDFVKKYIIPQLDNLVIKLKEIIGLEVQKRKPIIEEEFQKEKEELKKEIPSLSQSLWERLKNLIK